jgi:subtilisin family serine protease
MKHLTSIVLALLCAWPAVAQQKLKIDLLLDAYLKREHAPDEALNLYVHGDPSAVEPAVRAVGGTVKMTRPGLSAVRVPVHRVRELAESPAVQWFECALDPAFVMNDSMRVKAFVEPVHAGLAPLRQAYDGQDVVIGIIDSGLDWAHPDFRNADGTTRIVKYWDQTLPVNGQTPQPYGYGQVWNSAQINAGQMTSIDQPNLNGHGTTVAGSAVGNGLANGRHKGVAPKADIIIVSALFGGNFRANVADAVKYIFDEAAAMGKPAVINASLGSYLGSHDGLDASALFINDLLDAAPGRVMVSATGNSNTFPAYHVRTNVTQDTLFSWFLNNPNFNLGGGQTGAVFFEVWADMADFANVRYAIGADRATPNWRHRGRTPFHDMNENLGVLIVDTLFSFAGFRLGVVNMAAFPRGQQVLLQVLIPQPDSAAYRFRFMSTGSGRFDVWSHANLGTSSIPPNPPSVSQFPPAVFYVSPDKQMHIVDSWNCSPKVISVANYYNEQVYTRCDGATANLGNPEGPLANESSSGPTRLLLQKPDLAAPGSIALSAAPLSFLPPGGTANPEQVGEGCMHVRNGGTSMACPVVAGTAALYLQKCPNATWQEVMEAIRSTAFADAHTGDELPQLRWGFGKVNAFAALLTSSTPPVLDAPGSFCAGEQAVVSAPEGLTDLLWSDGSADPSILVDNEGPVYLVATNTSGCRVYSDTLSFVVHPLPQPMIAQAGPELTCTPAETYQWFLNGDPIPGETGQVHVATVSGGYSVAVTDENGCYAESAPVAVIVTGLIEGSRDAFAVWPSPVRDDLMLRLPQDAVGENRLRVFDARGAVVMEQLLAGPGPHTVPFAGVAPGVYTVEVGSTAGVWTARVTRER